MGAAHAKPGADSQSGYQRPRPAQFATTRIAALVEALMGFQFNHVGGGTKTRRPITLHMKYNSACVQPQCYLISEDVGEQEATLGELQVRTWASEGQKTAA